MKHLTSSLAATNIVAKNQGCSQVHLCRVQDKSKSKEVRVRVKTESKEVRVRVKTESKEVRVQVKSKSKWDGQNRESKKSSSSKPHT